MCSHFTMTEPLNLKCYKELCLKLNSAIFKYSEMFLRLALISSVAAEIYGNSYLVNIGRVVVSYMGIVYAES